MVKPNSGVADGDQRSEAEVSLSLHGQTPEEVCDDENRLSQEHPEIEITAGVSIRSTCCTHPSRSFSAGPLGEIRRAVKTVELRYGSTCSAPAPLTRRRLEVSAPAPVDHATGPVMNDDHVDALRLPKPRPW
jgi:hypothetical protein